jgi:hypothetical protein
MSKLFSALSIILLLSGVAFNQSTDAIDEQGLKLDERLSLFKPFIGPTWVGTIPGDARMGEIILKWEVILNGFAVRLERDILNSNHRLETTYHWDESSGKIAYVAISNNGYLTKGYVSGQGGGLISEGFQQGPNTMRQSRRAYRIDKEGKLYEDDQFRGSDADEWQRTHVSVFVSKSLQSSTEFPVLKGPYLGQKPPGLSPELFAPWIVSTGEDEATPVFSPDGREFFYSAKMGPEKRLTIMASKVMAETWTKPEIAPFSGKYYDAVTSISPDGISLFFNSMRPQKENEPPFEAQNIWVIEKQGNEWRNPRMLPPPVNSDARELGGFLSKDGYFYFSTSREGEISGKCRVKVVNGEFTGIESLDSLYDFSMPCFEVARDPDEKFIVFVSYDQADGYGKFDLYASFKKDDNLWTIPRNLGDRINTPANEHFPSFSPDGKYMFFVSDRITAEAQKRPDSPTNGSSDIYWVSTKILEELRPEEIR